MTASRRLRRPALAFTASALVSLVLLVAAVAAPAARAATSNSWTVAAGNVQAPGYQSAIMLADGRVLAVGGQGTKAELFNPASGTWSAAANMNISRAYATATLLPSGKVLVAGGTTGSAPLASAELYDPASNRWTLTGSMATGRIQHTATLLPSGKVLVAGGNVASTYGSIPAASAELYDPATSRFTRTGSMNQPRAVFTATLLRDGTVLAAEAGQTDLYDPATGLFTPTAAMPTDTDAITAVLLADGRVLTTGGSHGATAAATIYNPSTHTWQAAASLNWSRYYAPWGTVLLADGRVLVVGGNDYIRFAETWDPATGVWTNTGALDNARSSNFGLVRLPNGQVLVDGGAVPDEYCDNEGGGCFFGPIYPAEIYTP